MPLYTFYPCKVDGTSDSFVCFELSDDDEARIRALHVLDQHASSSHVVVWHGERKVLTRERMQPVLHEVLGQVLSDVKVAS
jgi:hypothetical protein